GSWRIEVSNVESVANENQNGPFQLTFINENILNIFNSNLPENFSLKQNYPNPFNPITTLRYDLPEDGLVNITIYDMMGRIVKTLVNGSQTAGYKSIQWNATNDKNEPVSAGLYLYTIQTGEFRQTKKMVLLK
ncbi:MAG: T9SS type A sorting domain-containing protein, partial [Candidatus Neomarinimicrobiota bacterium]